MSTWGFKGLLKRVLEFPPAAAEAALAPLRRMRMRYNDLLDRAELSTNGGGWLPISTGSAAAAQTPGIQPMQVILQSESSAALRRIPLYLVSAADGITPATGLTFAGNEIQLSKNGGAFANFAGSVTEVGDGLYFYTPTAGEIDTLGFLVVKVEKAAVRPDIVMAQVAAYNPNLAAVGVWSQPSTELVTPGTAGWSQLLSLYDGPYGPGIYVDQYYNPGNVGTVPGVDGTPNNPVGNLTAARTLADALNIRVYYIVGIVNLTATSQDFLFVGSSTDQRFDSIDIQNVDCFGATFVGMRLTGTFPATENAGNIACRGCELNSVDNLTGTFTDCFFLGTQTMPTGAFASQQVHLINCSEGPIFGSPAAWSLGGASPTNTQVVMSGWRGQLTISNLVNNTTVFRGTYDGARLTFDASCTSTISPQISGDVLLVNNSGTLTPNVDGITAEVTDDVLTAAHGAGSWQQ